MVLNGEKHWNWKGGRSELWYRKLMAEARVPVICYECQAIDRLHIHHKDGNHTNNVIENLEFLCPKCHHKKHPTVCSDERKRKLSKTMLGENNPNYGHKWTREMKIDMSNIKKGKMVGADNPMYGKQHTEETRQKLRELSRGKHYSSETEFKKGMIPWWKKLGYNSVKEAAKARAEKDQEVQHEKGNRDRLL